MIDHGEVWEPADRNNNTIPADLTMTFTFYGGWQFYFWGIGAIGV